MSKTPSLTSSEDWYKPGPQISEFHENRSRIRALIGGRGTGKTTSVAVECIRHCFFNAGAKCYVLRKTQGSNENTTLETLEKQVFPNMGSAYIDTGVSLFKKIDGGQTFRLPSRKAVELFNAWRAMNPAAPKSAVNQWMENVGNKFCGWIKFDGVPEARYSATRFRGYEASLLVFVEADQLTRDDMDLAMACLRWRGADPETCDERGFIRDSGLILDSNPPSPRHWLAEFEEETKDDPNVRYWHIPTRENAHNLPPLYVEDLERQYRRNPAMYKRMVLGQYAEAFDGTPVFYAFEETHSKSDLPWPKGAYLIRSWDFGATNACVFSAYWTVNNQEYFWDLAEYFATQSDTDRQCKAVIEITNTVFPGWNDRDICSGVKDFCDPAGNAKTALGSSIRVLNTYEIYPGFMRMGLQESIAVYNRLLEKKDAWGNHVYQIDKDYCPQLYVASLGGYRYPVEGEAGFGGDEPLKGPTGGNYDHIADASRYGKFNCLKLIRAEVEGKKGLTGPLDVKPTPNRVKRYY